MSLRCMCLGFIFLLVLLSRLGRGLLAFTLAETLLVMLFIPGAVCNAFASDAGKGDLRILSSTPLSSGKIVLGKLAGANLYTCLIIAFSAVAMFAAAIIRSDLHIWRLICANIVILILAFASAVIGLASSLLFRRNVFASSAFSYALILVLIVSIIISGPFIKGIRNSQAKSTIIKLALYANPLVMASRALGRIDIMRTRYMYELAEPIVGRGFSYPNWYSAGIIYFVTSCLVLIPIFTLQPKKLFLSD